MTRLEASRRREQIVAAAHQVLVEQGVPAATTRRIAAEAGVTVGLIHYHFATKDELFAEVLARSTGALVEAVRTTSAEGSSLEDCVRDLLARAVRRSGVLLGQLQLTIAVMRSPELAPLATAKYRDVVGALAQRFRVTPNPPADPEALALAFLTVADGLVVIASALPEASGLVAAAERTILSGAALGPGSPGN
ncbi:TetR/AcrR family transcriptional regulator [Allokutzneria sp. A3M-2-11 16]|uniref:TetR/AcrR family transcriptional regulator n=1 Tax=Allokutzneria sp. A3M-2-11 16 TaxID=2962043 RepID=UPI0020B8BD92|nr:TetR/AcrR family transcriptional regulator [Allokutzneria sp. A3M-2-11 16]MCP3803559.1 TetR/AcrR family transcriptional regulator [Allokutzneria sp. A3M-2-11 16]